MPVIAHCFECGAEMEVGMYWEPDDEKTYQDVCQDCSETEDVPEYNLYVVDDESLLDPGEDWKVRDKALETRKDRTELIEEYQEKHDTDDHPFGDLDEIPLNITFEILLRDADDETALEEAREEVRSRLVIPPELAGQVGADRIAKKAGLIDEQPA